MDYQLRTPVAFIIFNRPNLAQRVFEEIRKVHPPLLLVIADGPRQDHPQDEERCAKTRAIIEQVDWDCEVKKNYVDVNLGCRERIFSGLNWVFNEVEEAIILEDDCLPHPTFFRFCEELLDRYREDERICQISGINYQNGIERTECSYFFSRYNHIWGWASWRRAWKGCDVRLKKWPEVRKGKWLTTILGNPFFVPYWQYIFEKVYRGEINSWAYPWTFHCWLQNRLAILPVTNLIDNLGIGKDSTHTKGGHLFRKNEVKPITFPLIHPSNIICNTEADRYTEIHKHLIPFPFFNALQYKLRGLRYR